MSCRARHSSAQPSPAEARKDKPNALHAHYAMFCSALFCLLFNVRFSLFAFIYHTHIHHPPLPLHPSPSTPPPRKHTHHTHPKKHKPSLPPTRALLPAQRLARRIPIQRRRLNFIQHLEIARVRAARRRGSLALFVERGGGVVVAGRRLGEAPEDAVQCPGGDAHQCRVFEGWAREFVGLVGRGC